VSGTFDPALFAKGFMGRALRYVAAILQREAGF
jgi:hypothetical protein